MVASLTELKVELGIGSNRSTAAGSITWTDVSDYVEGPVTIQSGRPNEFAQPQPSTLALTFDNDAGLFTPGTALARSTPIRVSSAITGSTLYRFTGYVEQLAQSWEGVATKSRVAISAASGALRNAAAKTLKSWHIEQARALGATAIYELDATTVEASGQVVDQSTLGTGRLQPSTSPAQAIGAVAGIFPTDNGAATLGVNTGAIVDTGVGGVTLATLGAGATFAVECTVATTTTTVDNTARRVWGLTGSNATTFALEAVLTGTTLTVRGGVVTSGYTYNLPNLYTRALHHIFVGFTRNATGTVVPTVYVNGALVNAATTATIQAANPAADGTFTRLDIIGGGNNGLASWNGYMGRFSVFPTGLTFATAASQLYQAVVAGNTNQSTAARFATLAGFRGATVTVPTSPTVTTTAIQPLEGKTLLAALQQVVNTEGGMLYENGSGGLVFRGRDYRYNGTPALTVSATAGEVETDLALQLDDFGLVNQITVTSTSTSVGSTTTNNTTSQAQEGTFSTTVDTIAPTATTVGELSRFFLAAYGTPRLRVPRVSVDVVNATSAQRAAALALRPGDRLALSNLPSSAPASTITLLVEGMAETITGSTGWVLTLNVSPDVIATDYWTLGTSTLGTSTVLAY